MSKESESKNTLRAFAQPACLLVIISMIFGGVVVYFAIDRDFFPTGFYPIIVLMLPGFGGGLALFCVGCIAIRLLGIRVWAVPASNPGARQPDSNEPCDDG